MVIGLIATVFLIVALGCLALVLPRGGTDSRGTALIRTAEVVLKSAPIPSAWLIDGHPTTEAAEIARTADGTTCVYLWQTTSAIYRWHHASDETVSVIDGEVYLTILDANGLGTEQCLGAGDAAFFPAGATTRWRVPRYLRKTCTLTRPVPWPVANALNRLRVIKRWARAMPRPAHAVQAIAPSHAATEDRSWI